MVWEVTRTVRVRLDVPDDRKSDLHATNDKFQYCANRTADWAWRYPDEDCVTSKSEAEDAIYDQLREETDYLHANLVQKAIKRATDDFVGLLDRLHVDGHGCQRILYQRGHRVPCLDRGKIEVLQHPLHAEREIPEHEERIVAAERGTSWSATY